MKDIVLRAVIGDLETKVILHGGYGSTQNYDIMIDKYYHGVAAKMFDGWHVYTNKNSWLTPEDCDIIISSIDQLTYTGEPGNKKASQSEA